MKSIRVLLVDDHALMRAGIRALLRSIKDVEVVAEASDGREVLCLIGTHRPDVVLMDISMKGMNGLEATARVTKEFPGARVLILSIHTNEAYVLQALRAGAAGYLIKDVEMDELELAIQAVARGERYLCSSVSQYGIKSDLRRAEDAESGPSEPLTPRQREVLQLIAEGRSTKEIADTLQISVNTVVTHRMQLMEKLGIHNVADLVRYAVRMGLVSPNE